VLVEGRRRHALGPHEKTRKMARARGRPAVRRLAGRRSPSAMVMTEGVRRRDAVVESGHRRLTRGRDRRARRRVVPRGDAHAAEETAARPGARNRRASSAWGRPPLRARSDYRVAADAEQVVEAYGDAARSPSPESAPRRAAIKLGALRRQLPASGPGLRVTGPAAQQPRPVPPCDRPPRPRSARHAGDRALAPTWDKNIGPGESATRWLVRSQPAGAVPLA